MKPEKFKWEIRPKDLTAVWLNAKIAQILRLQTLSVFYERAAWTTKLILTQNQNQPELDKPGFTVLLLSTQKSPKVFPFYHVLHRTLTTTSPGQWIYDPFNCLKRTYSLFNNTLHLSRVFPLRISKSSANNYYSLCSHTWYSFPSHRSGKRLRWQDSLCVVHGISWVLILDENMETFSIPALLLLPPTPTHSSTGWKCWLKIRQRCLWTKQKHSFEALLERNTFIFHFKSEHDFYTIIFSRQNWKEILQLPANNVSSKKLHFTGKRSTGF